MKNKLSYVLISSLFLLAACGQKGASGSAPQDYEVVQEGSAAGVTSTIHGPGETIPPITGTNADTTSAFTLNPNALPPPNQPTTLGSTLPDQPYGGTPVYRPPALRPVQPEPEPTPAPVTETATPVAPPTDTAPPPEEEPEEEEPPPATDTTATEPPPPPPPAAV